MNLPAPKNVQLHLEALKMPVDFIAMDLIDPYEVITKRNQHTLTAICMFTNYLLCMLILDKTGGAVINAYMKKSILNLGVVTKPCHTMLVSFRTSC